MNDRYSRQEILPEIGKKGQERIAAGKVLVVGAGGLGCPALLYLAGAGVGTIGVIDHDVVDISNLQRQIIYSSTDQGRPKAQAAREALLRLNPDISVNAHPERLTAENALGIFSGYDVIIDGTDNFGAKFLINDAAVKLCKPVVYAAIQGFEGQISVFHSAVGPCYRCLHPQPSEALVMNCAEAGIIGPLAGMVGSMQAMECIKLLVNAPLLPSLMGQLCIIDASCLRTSLIKIPKRADCPVCSRNPADISLRDHQQFCSATGVVEIDASDAVIMPDARFIDVRELSEWDAGHIESASHVPLSLLQNGGDVLKQFQESQKYIVYCQKGIRSRKAVEILLKNGCPKALSLKGGYEGWCSLG